MRRTTLFTVLLLFIGCIPTAGGVTMEMVPVRNAGNAPDTRYYAAGSVPYDYRIGKYEVTAGQYTEFLNAVAKDDPNELYNHRMADPINFLGANILRTGTAPNFSYSVAFYLSESSYGTFDQAGNVWEFTETTYSYLSISIRGLRGGSFSFGSPIDLLASFPGERLGVGAVSEGIGFRVASVIPEPGTLLLGVLASAGMLVRRHTAATVGPICCRGLTRSA